MQSNNNNNIKNMHQSANEFSLFVGDLPHDCSDDKLQRLFQSKFKSVKRVQIIKNEDGSSRGFGFIRFEDCTDFNSALSQEMKIGNNTLRLDMAHRHYKNNRNRYNSFNSTGSNNSNHHHHHFSSNNIHHQPHYHRHHNQPHHHHHQQQQQHAPQQHGGQPHHANHQNNTNNTNTSTNKTLIAEPASAPEHQQQAISSNARGGAGNSQLLAGPSSSNSPSGQQAIVHQQHRHALHNSLPNQGQYDTHQQQQQKNNSQHSQTPSDTKNAKQVNLSLGGDEASQSQNQNQIQAQQPQHLQQHPPQQPLQQTQLQPSLPPALGGGNNIPVAMPNPSIVATTSATTTLSSSNMNHTSTAVLSNHNINTNHQQPLGPDLRSYMPTTMMDSQHLLGAEQASMMPQTSVYSYVYPYGPPPPFGYMHPPPPQPNPVIPISAVPPAPPNQASPSSGLSQQHTLTASNATRLNESQHPHQPQLPHASTADASAITGSMPGGVQAPPQGPQFYYYYPSPLYFDQAGAAAPPNMYHPQSFHPQFFAMPNPAYMPNAHQQQPPQQQQQQPTYNQHQSQPPSASQSDAPVMGQQQPHQPQVNLRTRDIDTTIE